MIRVQGLKRTYGDFRAVEDVDFEIGRGEIVGLLGHNGAGKTTIMKMLTGYLEPTGGRIEIDGLAIEPHRRQVQRQIGYLPENCPVYPEMSVVDYLEYAAALHGVPQPERMERVAEAIRRTELESKALDTIQTLSRGYRQRVGVAQAILHTPAILILDEPTNGLDPTQIHHMRDLIRKLAEHSTIILSTHILQEVEAVCDRVIVVRAGRKVLDARLSELQAGRRLRVELGATPDQAQALFANLPHVTSVEPLPATAPAVAYALTLKAAEDPGAAAADVARATVESGYPLYGLQAERRDLETIFGQVSTPEGGSTDA